LQEDAQFPTTKDALVQHQGWKLFDLTQDKRIRASEVLQKLPEKTYGSISEVIETLRSVMG
jgi:hypothetical protein